MLFLSPRPGILARTMPTLKRRATDADDAADAPPALVVRGRYLRVPDVDSWERKAAAKARDLEVSEMGFVADRADAWAAVRINRGSLDEQAARDRALLMTSDAMYAGLLAEAASKCTLRAPLPAKLDGGSLAENIYVSGNATAETLCVGDVLAVVVAGGKRRRGAAAADAAGDAQQRGGPLRLQVSSPCQPCSKVDQRLGKTWDGHGVRAHAARTGSRGWFVRVLVPGVLRDGDALAVVERPNPSWTLRRVSDLLYNIEGVCDALPYRWPTEGAAVARAFRGSREELRALATLPELASHEWREEARNMLSAWEAAEPERKGSCAIL